MIWVLIGWVACGVVSGLLTFGHFRWRYADVSTVAEDAGFAIFNGLIGPAGLIAVLVNGGWDGWQYWKNGRKSRREIARQASQDISQWVTSFSPTTAQAAASFNAFSQAYAGPPEPPVEEQWTPEPVLAWRWWTLNLERLTLVGNVSDWESGTVEAKHVGDITPWATSQYVAPHTKAPHPGCLCGVNALKVSEVFEYADRLFSPLLGLFTRPDPIHAVGRVALTGTIDEYEKGYRAERAEIVELVVLSDAPLFEVPGVLDALEARYGVRPTVQSRESWLSEMEVIHGYGKEDQEDHFGAGEGTGKGAGQGASQNRVSPLWHINFQTLRLHHFVDGEDKDDGLSGVTDA